MQIDIDNIAWWSCQDRYQDAVNELNDAILVATERENRSIHIMLRDIRELITSIGKLTGLDGTKRIGFNGERCGKARMMPC